jgi:hypothetical protein
VSRDTVSFDTNQCGNVDRKEVQSLRDPEPSGFWRLQRNG